MKGFCGRLLVSYLVVAMFIIGIAPNVNAGFSPSQLTGAMGQTREADLQNVRSFLENKVVADRFIQLGFNPAEVQARLTSMTDEQLHKVALKIDEVKVGGWFWTAIGVLFIIVLMILIYRFAVK
jgi:hypothetical protein